MIKYKFGKGNTPCKNSVTETFTLKMQDPPAANILVPDTTGPSDTTDTSLPHCKDLVKFRHQQAGTYTEHLIRQVGLMLWLISVQCV